MKSHLHNAYGLKIIFPFSISVIENKKSHEWAP